MLGRRRVLVQPQPAKGPDAGQLRLRQGSGSLLGVQDVSAV